jgi:OOP family OmpA-OmpF porin
VLRSIVAVALVAIFAAAPRADAQDLRFYVGGGAGPSTMEFEKDSLQISGVLSSTFTETDASSTAFKVYGGWRFNRFFAGEVGIVDFGKFRATRTVNPPGNGTVSAQIEVTGVYLDAVGTIPIGNSFELQAKVGALASSTYADRSHTGAITVNGNEDGSHEETNLHVSVGAEWRVTQRIAVRLEYDRAYGVGDANTGQGDVSAFFLGANYRF